MDDAIGSRTVSLYCLREFACRSTSSRRLVRLVSARLCGSHARSVPALTSASNQGTSSSSSPFACAEPASSLLLESAERQPPKVNDVSCRESDDKRLRDDEETTEAKRDGAITTRIAIANNLLHQTKQSEESIQKIKNGILGIPVGGIPR